MLPPDQRQILLEILRPPVGYHLDTGVGTTFTLSMDTALVVPLAFASFRLSGTTDPIAVMEAVRYSADRIDLFCQAGQMKVPSVANRLFAFLEPMIHQVRSPRPGYLFHPKVWLLRFVASDEPPALRLLCLTRNLTDDASWDISLRLDGTETETLAATNRPLVDFIAALPRQVVHPLPEERLARISRLARSVRRAAWELPEHVNDVEFWPLGIAATEDRPDFSGYRHLVMAPFLTGPGLAVVAPAPADHVTVVSRPDDLDRLEPDHISSGHTTMVVSAAADLDDPDAVDLPAAERDRLTGLHAKLYVVERNRAAHVFVGSANATGAAFGGNVEFLVELIGGATRLGVDRFLDPEAGFGVILEPYPAGGGAGPDLVEEALERLLAVLRAIAAQPFTATVTPFGDRYMEYIQAPALAVPPDMTVAVELVTRPGDSAPLVSGVPFVANLGPVAIDDVTPFVAVHATTPGPEGQPLQQATVVRCALIGDPAGRLDEIMARQVDTPEKFLRFLLLILGITDPSQFLDGQQSAGGGSWDFTGRSNGIFELLARAVADRPEVLDDLDRLIPRLRVTSSGMSVLPPGFDALWQAIQEARPLLSSLGAEVPQP